METKYVGKPIHRVDAIRKARGEALYAGDHYAEDMLYISVVRSQYAHAEILGIDTSAVPKGVTVVTGADIPVNIITYMVDDQPVLADVKTRFFGEAIALVAASSQREADESAKLVRVDYNPLPAVTTGKDAAAPNAPRIHESGNIIIPFLFNRGDVEVAFAESDLIIEKDFVLPTQEHIYMEPEAAFAQYDDEGVLEVYVTTQNVYLDKRGIVRSLGLKPEQVRVRADAIGGAFGGKAGHLVQSFPAIITWKTGKPSKYIASRRESIAASFKRHAAQAHVKVGFKKDGTLTAYASDMFLDTGAYINYGPVVLGMMSEHMPGPYKVDNVKLNNLLCYTNRAPASAMRGFGAPQAAYLMENIMNMAADQLNMDPIELRLHNAWEYGDLTCLGEELKYSVGIKDALKLAQQSDLWKERLNNTDPNIGYGMAAGHIGVGMGKDTYDICRLEMIYTSGKYHFYTGLTDMGQGSTTGIAMIAAEHLGVPIEQVEVTLQDTGVCCDSNDMVASRSAYIGGNAAIMAIDKWRMEGEPNDTKIYVEAAYPESELDLGIVGLPHCMYSYMAQVAKVKVNPSTGMVQVLEVFGATEAGRIINPASVEGQVCGGILMSMGYALTEELHYNERGIPVETDMAKYIVATSLDMPQITAVTVDGYEDTGAYGAKGVGEIATVAITPAIAQAVRYVVPKLDVTSIPLDTELILDAMEKREVLR